MATEYDPPMITTIEDKKTNDDGGKSAMSASAIEESKKFLDAQMIHQHKDPPELDANSRNGAEGPIDVGEGLKPGKSNTDMQMNTKSNKGMAASTSTFDRGNSASVPPKISPIAEVEAENRASPRHQQ